MFHEPTSRIGLLAKSGRNKTVEEGESDGGGSHEGPRDPTQWFTPFHSTSSFGEQH